MSAAPWDRQPDESSQAFEAFVAYRDGQPDATVRSVAHDLNKSQSLIAGWSTKHHWQDRLRAWEVEVDRERQAAQLDLARRRVDRHRQTAEVAQEALMRPLAEILRRFNQDAATLQNMPLWDVYRLAVQAARALPRVNAMERLALGLSSESIDVKDQRRLQGERDARASSDADLDQRLLGIGDGVVSDGAEAFLAGLPAGELPPG